MHWFFIINIQGWYSPSSKKSSFSLSPPQLTQYTRLTPSPGDPPFGWTQKLFLRFFRALLLFSLKWKNAIIIIRLYSWKVWICEIHGWNLRMLQNVRKGILQLPVILLTLRAASLTHKNPQRRKLRSTDLKIFW